MYFYESKILPVLVGLTCIVGISTGAVYLQKNVETIGFKIPGVVGIILSK